MPEALRVLNVNVGVLGHVDSGKTSLGERSKHSDRLHTASCLSSEIEEMMLD